jgi:hypothetical protein
MDQQTGKTVFIVWYSFSRRAETLATELQGRVIFQYEAGLKRGWQTPWRYLVQGWKTWQVLQREQPDLVLVQSPPFLAPLFVALWCKLWSRNKSTGRRVPYIIDCHPGTFHDVEWKWGLPVLYLLARGAEVTLLCNEPSQEIVAGWRVPNIFLPDGLPDFTDVQATSSIGSVGTARVAFICTYATAEPVAEIFAAARLSPEVTYYITGDIQRAQPDLLAERPDNVVLTGFLRGGEYVSLLKNVHGIAILTKQSKDLSCGAYEALALGKPALISDWPGSRRIFQHGFVYCENTPVGIAQGVQQMLTEQAVLIREADKGRNEYTQMREPRLTMVRERREAYHS